MFRRQFPGTLVAMPLHGFDPVLRQWFTQRLGAPTEPQLQGWPLIRAGHDVLITAPTGSGKTLAAFSICLDGLVRQTQAGTLPEETQVIYVSPLKALSNDVRKNLERPLEEIAALAGWAPGRIRTAVRTGDTPTAQRQSMLKHAPHVLVTTPESLYILLTAERSRQMLRTAHTVIVDEIHAIADDKRGSHLALSLARLDALAGRRLQRVGLSATVKPLEAVAAFLGPHTKIVNVGHRRQMDIAIEVPRDELGPITTHEMWAECYERLATLIRENRTTLVFVNTRRLSERVSHALAQLLGEGAVLPHHGSLSIATRLNAETRLKNGELRAVVATASLELGIDIGTVDLVCQIGSPRSIAVALQRIGRSGHWVGAQPKGRLFPHTRDELIECAALVSAIRSGSLEELAIPQNALDILAQQIVAETACGPWQEDQMFALVREAYPYRHLARVHFDEIITMLSEGIAHSRGRSGAYLHRDQVNGVIKARRGARLAAITSGGAIPDNAAYSVIAEPEGKTVGTLDEDFAIESLAGDVFLLGTHSWRIKRVEPGRVRVEDAHGAAPSIPFWLGEAPGRSRELSEEVAQLRETMLRDGFDGALCGLCEAGTRQAVEYVRDAAKALGGWMPSRTTVVAERFFDEAGGMQLVIHSPFGNRINRAWGLALRKRFCRTFNFELQAAATDNGIVISLSEQHAFPLELVFKFLKSGNVEDVLTQALLDAPMFTARWRWNASRALAVLRFSGGRKVPAPLQRMRSDDLLAAVFPDQVACAENLTGPPQIPDHPLVRETIENCLREAMDVDGLRELLAGIEGGTIAARAIDTTEPSPFTHEILSANPFAFLDDAPLEERRTRAVQLRRTMRSGVENGIGLLDPAAITEVSREVWPEPRDADELHDALMTLVALPPVPDWQTMFHELAQRGSAHTHDRAGRDFWVATERRLLIADATATVRGWLECLGPVTATSLAERLAFPRDVVETALLQIEAEGQVMRGHYTAPDPAAEIEWCNRRVLARIHRLTLGRLRREIEPVSALDFNRFLCRWHHLSPGSQLVGVEGVRQVIRQLQGYEVPAAVWEPQILARRIRSYEPEFLDELCLSGEVMWGRLSPHPALDDEDARRVRPTRMAPVTMLLREDVDWLADAAALAGEHGLSHPARETCQELRQAGASFFVDLVRHTRRLASEVEDALWELVAAGLVTADGFENLRALLDPKRRRGEGRGRTLRPRHAAGRWALIRYRADTVTAEQRAERFAAQLLNRWGVLMRDLLARETLAPPWRDLLPVLRRMEARGEIRGGRFVAGFSGEQYARPEAIELLRAVRRDEQHSDDQMPIAHADPLNLAGILLPGPRLNPLIAGSLQLRDYVLRSA